MARPQKDGLDYFPLDVDIDQDDKVALIEAQHGVTGFAIVIKLFMKIYKNSYFYEWTEKEQLLFSKRINVDINLVNVIINDCIKWGLFDGDILKIRKILTSKGIQKRYIKASERRQKVEIEEKYLLLDSEEVNDYKNLVIVNVNDNSKGVNDNINPQSKVKESKGKKSKVKESSHSQSNTNLDNKAIELCKYYSALIPGKDITKYLATLKIFIEKYGFDWTKEALQIMMSNKGEFIKNYMEVILQHWYKNGKNTVCTNKYKDGVKRDGFNSYPQRKYDGKDGRMSFQELEKKLLGYDLREDNNNEL